MLPPALWRTICTAERKQSKEAWIDSYEHRHRFGCGCSLGASHLDQTTEPSLPSWHDRKRKAHMPQKIAKQARDKIICRPFFKIIIKLDYIIKIFFWPFTSTIRKFFKAWWKILGDLRQRSNSVKIMKTHWEVYGTQHSWIGCVLSGSLARSHFDRVHVFGQWNYNLERSASS